MRILSLGAGVQSSTLALMAEHGELDKPDFAVFADTQSEPASVYKWLDYLESKLSFPICRVSRGNLREDALRVHTSANSQTYLKPMIPAYTMTEKGDKGNLFRHCTLDYKIVPIQRFVKEKMEEQRFNGPVTMWIGISTDEAQRMKDSRVPYIQHIWPLIDLKVSRQQCFQWMRDHGYPEPPRSSCTFCPYHRDKEWHRLKTQEPGAFQDAVLFEKQYQASAIKVPRLDGVPFLHDSRVPLDQIEFNPDKNQLDLFGNECEGMCGV